MSFDSLDKILQAVTRQPGWESYRQYRLVIDRWQVILPPRLCVQTRPVSLSRGVFSVATRGAALAQELSLQRPSLLQKMNASLTEPIEDIRFSSARWYERSIDPPPSALDPVSIEEHPSYEAADREPKGEEGDGFARWQARIRQRAQRWPLCPQCQSSTPSGEIDRWGCCAFCAVRAWQ